MARNAAVIRDGEGDVKLFEKARNLRHKSDNNPDLILRRDVEFLRYEIERFVLEVTA